MSFVSLKEAKERLSIDFDSKDIEIQERIDSIEGYLFNATGVDWKDITNEKTQSVAKEYILHSLYVEYYSADSELEKMRLTSKLKQLQFMALVV